MIPKRYFRVLLILALGYIGLYCLYVTKALVNKNLVDARAQAPRNETELLLGDHIVLTSRKEIHQQTINIPVWQRNLEQRRTDNERQYFLTAAVRVRIYKEDMSKWTVSEFKQWMHYQFWAGAEHIYVCNHFLNESESIAKPLEKYLALGLVTVLPWNHIKAVRGSKTYEEDNSNNQVSCYQHVLEKYGNRSVWQYNFDMDENPYCPKDQREGFLVRFLRSLSESETGKPQSERIVDIRVQNFLLHGQGDRKRNITYDRINRISPRIANGNWKTIYQTKYIEEVGMHGVQGRQGKMWIADTSKLKMLHYWGARLQEWGPDTPALKKYTVEFNDVRNTIAVSIRHSLIAMNETDAFSYDTGP